MEVQSSGRQAQQAVVAKAVREQAAATPALLFAV
jgi:hypothetical protein